MHPNKINHWLTVQTNALSLMAVWAICGRVRSQAMRDDVSYVTSYSDLVQSVMRNRPRSYRCWRFYINISLTRHIWGLVCHTHVSRAWAVNCVFQYLWDGITSPCFRYPLLAYRPIYDNNLTMDDSYTCYSCLGCPQGYNHTGGTRTTHWGAAVGIYFRQLQL